MSLVTRTFVRNEGNGMKRLLLLLCLIMVAVCWSGSALAQSYVDSIHRHRAEKHAAAFGNPAFPLNTEDEVFLHYYEPNEDYRVRAAIEFLIGEKPFRMPTYDGTSTDYIRFAQLTFTVRGEHVSLIAYQNTGLLANPRYNDHLFVPFNDLTNGEETYGGGRYLDLSKADIVNGHIILDFNKAYNPYCAYSDGYRCPIPPPDNDLDVPIRAGEKSYTGSIRQRPRPVTPPDALTDSERQLVLTGDTSQLLRIIQDTVEAEHTLLKSASVDVDPKDDLLPLLAKRMYLAMTDTLRPGVGIAAPQVGVNRNVIWVQRFDKVGAPFEFYVNPKIVWRSNLMRKGWEGCLSIPDTREEVYRHYTIRLTYQDLDGNYHDELIEGFTSVIVQHEVDHLYGILFTDRLIEQQGNIYHPVDDAIGLYLRDPMARP